MVDGERAELSEARNRMRQVALKAHPSPHDNSWNLIARQAQIEIIEEQLAFLYEEIIRLSDRDAITTERDRLRLLLERAYPWLGVVGDRVNLSSDVYDAIASLSGEISAALAGEAEGGA